VNVLVIQERSFGKVVQVVPLYMRLYAYTILHALGRDEMVKHTVKRPISIIMETNDSNVPGRLGLNAGIGSFTARNPERQHE
jgi:hypothetical protein